jgi:hypothetical protein
MGWDISADAKADAGEKITRAQVVINGVAEYDKTLVPPVSSWQEQLIQRGQYPGENTVRVIATNEQGDATESIDFWS